MPNEDLNQTQNTTPSQDLGQNYYDPNTPVAPNPNYGDVPAPSDVNQSFYQSPYGDYNQPQTGVDSTQSTPYGDYTQTTTDVPAPTFEEKKTGNKLFVYGAIGLLAVLISAAGVLIYLNFGNSQSTPTPAPAATNDTKTDTTPATSSNTQPAINNTLTGGANTPATKARVYNETKIPSTWLKQKFTSASVDSNGNCVVANICGESADPDNDGLTNIEEYNFQSDPLNPDTDNDGYSDGDEVYVYHSDPIKDDSDGDTFKDGAEIGGCYDPTVNETGKMSQAKIADIATQIGLRPLHANSKTALTAAGATTIDLTSKGLPSAKCTVATTSTTTPTTTGNTTTPTTTTTTPTTTSTTNSN